MILISGDIHGKIYSVTETIGELNLTPNDTIILLGDVGLNFYGNNYGDIHRKKRLNSRGVQIFCVHGNHEMRPESISTYQEIPWHGGNVYVEEEFPNLLFAKDGEVYDFNGKKAVIIGGAYSVDKWYRLRNNLYWFADEQPSQEIKDRVERKLNELGWRVDMVFSHTCPEKYIPLEALLSGVDQSTVDNSTEKWLDTIEERLNYDDWYCGHWHINKRIDRMHFLMDAYEEIQPKEAFCNG